ncbi:MAG: Gfo/Idh/MocA family oxidoreductase [Prolixibacteraceae bacterium]|nr:Gfo/Idh/MocA family oxidoreductase [Prolixibacteraceae bacterium]
MKNNRREFIKKTGAVGIGLAGSGFITGSGESFAAKSATESSSQIFNMHGYSAPKLDVVRIGIIGLGNRGSGSVVRLASINGVEIKALCDLDEGRARSALESISFLDHKPDLYYGGENEWKKVCERSDIDLIAVVTPWPLHTPMCLYAMENDKHAYTELPASLTIEGCWQLVETSERTKKHCVQMSGSCSGGMSAVILNMVRQGFFGEIIHGEGAYIHTLIDRILGLRYNTYMYRLEQNIGRHGNLYPQHGLVPILQMMDINYGDKMEHLSSVSSDDFSMNEYAKKLAAEDDMWKPYVDRDFRGNINTSIIKTNKGRTIMVQHDVSSPRPNVRFELISGTKGVYQASQGKIATSHEWLSDQEFDALVKKYTPKVVKVFEELYQKSAVVTRSGRSYARVSPTDWRLIDCLHNGLPVDMDVYDAAVSSSVIPLSIQSAANRGNSVDVPDFTRGSWKTNQRGMDINLQRGGGTTKLR